MEPLGLHIELSYPPVSSSEDDPGTEQRVPDGNHAESVPPEISITAVRLAEDGSWDQRVFDSPTDDVLVAWIEAAGSRIAANFSSPLIARHPTFPFTQNRKMRQALPFTLEPRIPGRLNEYEQNTRLHKHDNEGIADVTLLRRDHRQEIEEVAKALPGGLRYLEPVPLMQASVQGESDCAVILLEEARTSVVVLGERSWRYAFTVPIGAAHLSADGGVASLRARLQAGIDERITRWRVAVSGNRDPEVLDPVFAPLPEVIEWSVLEWGHEAPSDEATFFAWMAAGAAAGRYRPFWNFAPRRSLFSGELLKHPVVRHGALPALAVIVLMLTSFHAGTRAIRSEAEAAQTHVRDIYRRNFPQSRIVDPARQMRSVVERLGGGEEPSGDDAPVLAHMASFHEAVSAGSEILVTELRMADQTWIAKGEAPAFADVDSLKSALDELDWTDDVRVQRAEQTVDRSAIRFQLTWSSARESR